MLVLCQQHHTHYIYIYAFSRHFYRKRLTVHSGLYIYCQYVCSLGFEPMTFALLMQRYTTEPQEQSMCIHRRIIFVFFAHKKYLL